MPKRLKVNKSTSNCGFITLPSDMFRLLQRFHVGFALIGCFCNGLLLVGLLLVKVCACNVVISVVYLLNGKVSYHLANIRPVTSVI